MYIKQTLLCLWERNFAWCQLFIVCFFRFPLILLFCFVFYFHYRGGDEQKVRFLYWNALSISVVPLRLDHLNNFNTHTIDKHDTYTVPLEPKLGLVVTNREFYTFDYFYYYYYHYYHYYYYYYYHHSCYLCHYHYYNYHCSKSILL